MTPEQTKEQLREEFEGTMLSKNWLIEHSEKFDKALEQYNNLKNQGLIPDAEPALKRNLF